MVALNDISNGKNWHTAKTCILGARSATAGLYYLSFSLTFCVEAIWYTFKQQFSLLLAFACHSHRSGNIPLLAENRHKAWNHSGQSAEAPGLAVGASWSYQTPPPTVWTETTDGLQSRSSYCPAWYCVIYCLWMTRPLFRTLKKRTEFIAYWRKGKLHRSVVIPSCTTYC